MSVHVSKQENLTQSNPESFSDKINPDFQVYEEMFLKEYSSVAKPVTNAATLSDREHRVYSVVQGYAGNSGRCFVSDRKVNEENPWLAPTAFTRATTSLHDKKLIYKTQILLKGKRGSYRVMTTVQEYKKYIVYLLKVHKNAEEAADVLMHFTGLTYSQAQAQVRLQWRKPDFIQKNSITCEQVAPDHMRVSRMSIEVSKDTSYIEERGGEGLAPFSLENIKEEMLKRKLPKDKIQVGLQFWKAKKDKLLKKKDPIAYFMSAVLNGWAQEQLLRHHEEIEAEKIQKQKRKTKEENLKCNKEKADEIRQWATDNPDLNITFSGGPYHIIIGMKSTKKNWHVVFSDKNALIELERIFHALKMLKKYGPEV